MKKSLKNTKTIKDLTFKKEVISSLHLNAIEGGAGSGGTGVGGRTGGVTISETGNDVECHIE